MKVMLEIAIIIVILLTSISYASVDNPVTREEFKQKVQQQRAKIKELETLLAEQEKQIIGLKWEVYHIKYEPEPNEIQQQKDKGEENEKTQVVIKELKAEINRLKEVCRNAGIDPNSEPNNIKKLMTEEQEKAHQERLTNYKEYFKRGKKYEQKQLKSMSQLDKAIAQAEKTDSTKDWEKAFGLCNNAEELKKVSEKIKKVEQNRRKTATSSKSKFSERERKAILESKYFIGMTQEALNESWGPPEQISKSGTKEKWTYGFGIARMYFHFEDGKLKMVENEN